MMEKNVARIKTQDWNLPFLNDIHSSEAIYFVAPVRIEMNILKKL